MANHLCSFEADDTCGIKDIVIHEDFFARTHFQNQFSHIEVFNWRLSTSTAHCKAIILPGTPIVRYSLYLSPLSNYMSIFRKQIRPLPNNRLVAFSREYMMIYSFNTIKGTDITAPTLTSHVTKPLWKIPFPGTRTDRGGLSEGISDEIASYFIVKAKTLYSLLVPHDIHQTPRFREFARFDRTAMSTCAIGFQKAFLQHSDLSISRLSFSGKPQDLDGIVAYPSSHVVTSRDCPTIPSGTQLPKIDEETGRIVQELKDSLMIIDTAILYRR